MASGDARMALRKRLIVALAIATAATLLALWMTQLDPAGGKALYVGALAVMPLMLAAKAGITGWMAAAVAFIAYLVLALFGLWIAGTSKQVRP